MVMGFFKRKTSLPGGSSRPKSPGVWDRNERWSTVRQSYIGLQNTTKVLREKSKFAAPLTWLFAHTTSEEIYAEYGSLLRARKDSMKTLGITYHLIGFIQLYNEVAPYPDNKKYPQVFSDELKKAILADMAASMKDDGLDIRTISDLTYACDEAQKLVKNMYMVQATKKKGGYNTEDVMKGYLLYLFNTFDFRRQDDAGKLLTSTFAKIDTQLSPLMFDILWPSE